jgi:hypothetical protein
MKNNPYAAIIWKILAARLRNDITPDDAKAALAAAKAREHPKVIERFIEVATRANQHLNRRTA